MKLKIGDKVKLKDLKGSVLGFTVGDVCTITDKSIGIHEFEIEREDGLVGFADSSSLKLVEKCDCKHKCSRKKKFNVGDIVIANEKANDEYNITKEGWKGVIVSINELFDDSFFARGFGNENSSLNAEYFCANATECFDVVKKFGKEELLELPIGTKIITDSDTHSTYIKVNADNTFISTEHDVYLDEENIDEDLNIYDVDEEFGTKIVRIETPEYKTLVNVDWKENKEDKKEDKEDENKVQEIKEILEDLLKELEKREKRNKEEE